MAKIYKRGNVWWGRITHKGNERRESLETNDRATAQQRLKDWIERIKSAEWGSIAPMTYDDAMVHFLTRHVPTLKLTSQRRYKTSIRMMTPKFEGRLLNSIGSSLLSEYEHDRRQQGAKAPTIRRDLACLSSMFECVMMDRDLDITNPVLAFLKKRSRRGNLKESAPRTRYLSHEEETRLLAACDGRLKHLKPIISFAIDTGLRLEEQLSLTHAQINHLRKEVEVIVTKTGVPRLVPLLQRSAQISAQQPVPKEKPHYLFNKASNGARYSKLTRGLASACKVANIAGLRWHDLRRTCGCRLLQDHKLTMKEVSVWLGHSTMAQTERAYAFLVVDQLHIGVGTNLGTAHADLLK